VVALLASLTTWWALLPAQAQALQGDALALCTAMQLASQAIAVADEIKNVAEERLARARKDVAACQARPDCGRDERINLEQEVRDAKYQRDKSEQLAAVMQTRAAAVRKQFEQFRGADATRECTIKSQ
jgi:hypothetical protein